MTRIGLTTPPRRLLGLVAAATLVLATAACSGSGVVPSVGDAVPASTTTVAAGQRIVLRFDQAVVPATLDDTATGRQFVAMLPLTLKLGDPMGQAKSGHLLAPLSATGAEPITDPEAGGLYYVPGNQMVAMFYVDLDQTVPPPGLIRLGTIHGDLTLIAAAGNRVRVRIDLADGTHT